MLDEGVEVERVCEEPERVRVHFGGWVGDRGVGQPSARSPCQRRIRWSAEPALWWQEYRCLVTYVRQIDGVVEGWKVFWGVVSRQRRRPAPRVVNPTRPSFLVAPPPFGQVGSRQIVGNRLDMGTNGGGDGEVLCGVDSPRKREEMVHLRIFTQL